MKQSSERSKALFTFDELGVVLGKREVLNIPSLSLNDGEIIAITGPNGSGKTTLLHVLIQLLLPYRGTITYRGRNLSLLAETALDQYRRDLGVVLQSPYLFRTNVENNVAYGLARRGLRRTERLTAAGKAIALVGLQGFEKRPHDSLSGGEAQRVALARAIVTDPKVLLLDEPLANVDPASRSVIERILTDKCRDEGVSVIFTTHDIEQAYRISDEVITLVGGSPQLGAMENVFHGAVYQSGSSMVFDTGRMTIYVPGGSPEGTKTASVPPESILVSLQTVSTSARNSIRGKINRIQERNGSVEITVRAEETLTSRITRDSFNGMGLNLGVEVSLIFKAEAVRLY